MLNELWLLASVILLFIGLVASQGLLLVVGALSVIVALVAKYWHRFAFKRVSHSRSLSNQRAFIGDSIEYTITLSNEKPLPLMWVDIQDTFPNGLELHGAVMRSSANELAKQHCITTSLLPYQQVSWKYKLGCAARGYHRIGPAQLRGGDIFGFTSAEAQFTDVNHILVYPRVVDLGQLVFPEDHPLGENKGWMAVSHDTSRFLRQRDYSPTDPMKHIDWKATARRLRLQTKVYDPVLSLNILITLNATTSEYAWQGSNRRYFERAVTAAASVANYAAERGYSFGLVSNAVATYSGRWLSVPMGRSAAQLPHVLESLAMAGPYVVTQVTEVLRNERASLPPGATVVIISSILNQALADEIAQIKQRGYQVRVLYTGDLPPTVEVPGVTVLRIGKALEPLDQHESVFSD